MSTTPPRRDRDVDGDSLTMAEFLRVHRARIVDEWTKQVRARLPGARRTDKLALEDNIPDMLERIAARLEADGGDVGKLGDEGNPLDDLSELHALERLLIGYDLRQIVDEYRLLRRTIVGLYSKLAGRDDRGTHDISFLNECLDLAVSTAAHRFADERQRLIARWQLAAEAAEVGLWDLDLPTRVLVGDARYKALFGLSPDAPTNFATIMDAVHPDDRAGVEAALSAALEPYGDGHFHAEYRTIGIADSVERWIVGRGRVTERDSTGAPRRLMGTVVDVGDRVRAEKERELFVAAIGHDLRNPLTTIKALADRMVRTAGASAEEDTRAAARIASTAERMARMIDELLDFSRSQLGTLPLERHEADLREIFAEVVAEIEHAHPDVKVTLASVGPTTGYWDRGRLTHVAQNLLSNAVHHGDVSKPIVITLRGADEVVTFSVHNSGSPIDRAALATLFEPYRRGRFGGQGLGLGLYIVREVLEANGGGIAVHSDAASGTTFSAILPRRSPK
jgi:signal transduction histidine kinase